MKCVSDDWRLVLDRLFGPVRDELTRVYFLQQTETSMKQELAQLEEWLTRTRRAWNSDRRKGSKVSKGVHSPRRADARTGSRSSSSQLRRAYRRQQLLRLCSVTDDRVGPAACSSETRCHMIYTRTSASILNLLSYDARSTETAKLSK